MAEQKWTTEQTAAIYTRGSHLLVSAAAGAGKTAVLVERIIRSITDPARPLDIDQLLVVTFTNAAAAEMRERIGLALMAEIAKTPQAAYLQRQLTRLTSAPIMTLHAFCLDVLRQYYYCIDLDPAFKMANEAETGLLRAQAMENVFEQLYEQGDYGLLMLADMYGGSRDDRRLGEIILKLYNYSRSHPQPQQWLSQAAEQFSAANLALFETSPWVREVKQYLTTQLTGCQDKLQQAFALAKNSPGLSGYAAILSDDLLCIDELLQSLARGWSCLTSIFPEKLAGTLPRIKGECDEVGKEKVQQLRREVKKLLGKLQGEFFARSVQEWQTDAEKLAPVAEALVFLVNAFAKEYAVLKTAKGVLDFSDLEHKCLEILCDEYAGESVAAQDLCLRYAEILVDEYQDINEVQENILRLVSQRPDDYVPMFMVGDVKQSIYRFRLAEPSLFLHKYNIYAQASPAGCRIDLACNFRSSARVIDAVNFLFRQIMTLYVGEMAYDGKAQLICGLERTGEPLPKVEMQLIDKSAELSPEQTNDVSDQTDDEENLAGFAAEANIIAQRIAELIRESDHYQIYDKKLAARRPLQYRDIVILLRATKGKAELLLDVLRKYDIPAYAETSMGYFAALEVKVMLSLLQIIDNPRQDIPLAAVLRSPVCGLQAEDLAAIRTYAPRSDYWDAVLTCAGGDSSLAAKLQAFCQQLDNWRTLARQQPLSVLIWQLLQDTNIYDYVGSMPGGIQRQANLRALYTRACEYEQTNFRGLFRFLRFIEGLQQSGSDLAAARALGENENVVRIMSVHKSKGLEFPVVFVADIGKRFNKMDLYGPVLCHKELGLGPDIVEPERSIRYASFARKAIQLRLKREALSEELRILYVALTRAREMLILVGTTKNIAKSKDSWSSFLQLDQETLPDWYLSEANCWLDWIAPAVARHRDGGELRNNPEYRPPMYLEADPSQWQICLWDYETAGRVRSEASSTDGQVFAKISALETLDIAETSLESRLVTEKLNWLYPHRAAAGYPAKLAVSELKKDLPGGEGDFLPQPLIYNRPRFLQAKTDLTPAERGSALHLVMQHVTLAEPLTASVIQAQISELAERHILTDEQAQAVDADSIAAFFATELGQRLSQAKEVLRELRFSMVLAGNRLYDELEAEEIFVQGVIDCLFAEADGMVVIDYKTDWAGSKIAPAVLQAYQRQLAVYTEAVAQLLKRPVKEAYLYFVATGEIVRGRELGEGKGS